MIKKVKTNSKFTIRMFKGLTYFRLNMVWHFPDFELKLIKYNC